MVGLIIGFLAIVGITVIILFTLRKPARYEQESGPRGEIPG